MPLALVAVLTTPLKGFVLDGSVEKLNPHSTAR